MSKEVKETALAEGKSSIMPTRDNNVRVMTSQHETGGKNHIVYSFKMYTPPEHNLRHNLSVRENVHLYKQHFGTR